MTKVLVTGSAGFLGSHLCRWILTHTDWQIVGLDRIDFAGDLERTRDLPRDRFAFTFHDLRSPFTGATVRNVVTGNGRFSPEPFDYVAHLAAGSHVDRSVADPVGFFEDNVLGTVHLLEYLRHGALSQAGVMLHFSTDEVFGPANDEAFVPWARHNPTNPYAAAKAGSEAALPAYVNCYGMRIMCTHGTNFFGAEQDDEKFIPIAIKRILAGEPVYIHTVKGEPCSRYYTHSDNAASAVLHLLKFGDCIDPDDATRGKYSITGEREISNVELVQSIGHLLGKEPVIKLVENPPTRIRPDLRYRVSGDELEATGWKRPVCFEEGLRRTVEAIAGPLLPNLVSSPALTVPVNDNGSRKHG